MPLHSRSTHIDISSISTVPIWSLQSEKQIIAETKEYWNAKNEQNYRKSRKMRFFPRKMKNSYVLMIYDWGIRWFYSFIAKCSKWFQLNSLIFNILIIWKRFMIIIWLKFMTNDDIHSKKMKIFRIDWNYIGLIIDDYSVKFHVTFLNKFFMRYLKNVFSFSILYFRLNKCVQVGIHFQI